METKERVKTIASIDKWGNWKFWWDEDYNPETDPDDFVDVYDCDFPLSEELYQLYEQRYGNAENVQIFVFKDGCVEE